MKIWKVTVSVIGTLFFSGCMFYSFAAGAPENPQVYLFLAGAFSVLLPAFTCTCIHYILHLQKRIEDLENHSNT